MFDKGSLSRSCSALSFVEDMDTVSSGTSSGMPGSPASPTVVDNATPATPLTSKTSTRFFMQDTSPACFLASGTLYQINGADLARHSAWFRRHLEQPEENSLPLDWQRARLTGSFGSVDVFVNYARQKVIHTRPSFQDATTGAIILDNISSTELDAFLSILYPTNFKTFGLSMSDVRDWAAVLKVAHPWECPAITELAVERVDRILSASSVERDTSFERLMLARAHNVDEWVEGALAGLCKRVDKLSREEMDMMSPEDREHIVSAREEALRRELLELRSGSNAYAKAAKRNGPDSATALNMLFSARPPAAAGFALPA